MVSYKLLTDYGTLELPSENCYYCFNNMQFAGCSWCPVTTQIKSAAKVVVKHFDKLINEEEEE